MKLILLIFSSLQALAVIDPGTGAYLLQHTDISTSEAITPFKISRTYNHKNTTSGYFGKKWCSNLDEMIVAKNNKLVIQKCGRDTDAVFVKKDKIFVNSDSSETIYQKTKDNGYVLVARTELVSFNSEGRVISRRLKSSAKKPYLQVLYNQQQEIKQIVHMNKWRYSFTYDKSNRINRVRGPAKTNIVYTYDINGNLNQVTDAWKNSESYSNDSEGRITTYKNESVVEHVEYQTQNNMVKSAKDQKGCTYNFTYDLESNSTKLKTTIINSCEKEKHIFVLNSSPIFFKNVNAAKLQSRMPSSEPPKKLTEKITSKPSWQSFKGSVSTWNFVVNEYGNIIMIKEKNLQTKTENIFLAKYENQKLTEMQLNKKGTVRLIYINNKLNKISSLINDPEAQETFHFFTRFAKEKADEYL